MISAIAADIWTHCGENLNIFLHHPQHSVNLMEATCLE